MSMDCFLLFWGVYLRRATQLYRPWNQITLPCVRWRREKWDEMRDRFEIDLYAAGAVVQVGPERMKFDTFLVPGTTMRGGGFSFSTWRGASPGWLMVSEEDWHWDWCCVLVHRQWKNGLGKTRKRLIHHTKCCDRDTSSSSWAGSSHHTPLWCPPSRLPQIDKTSFSLLFFSLSFFIIEIFGS